MKELVYYKNIQIMPEIYRHRKANRNAKQFTIEPYNIFSQQEINKMESAVLNMAEYSQDVNRIIVVKNALNDFLTTLDNSHHGCEAISDLESNLQNYIVKFDTYKNHWEKKIGLITNQDRKDRFKKIFEDATHNAFDTSNGFALTCCFRDYIIHGSNLIDNFQTKLSSANAMASRDKLLKDWKWNQTKTKLISSQPEFINLRNVAIESFEALSDIHSQLINARITDIIGDCKYLLMQYEKIKVPEKYLPVWHIVEKQDIEPVIIDTIDGKQQQSPKGLSMNMLPVNWKQYQGVYEYWKRIN